MAYRLGDQTAKDAQRLTMNPIAHIDPIGTVLLPAFLMFSGMPVFGWAKPVPFNPAHFKDHRTGTMLVGAAGPGSNILIAVAAGILFRFFATSLPLIFAEFLIFLCLINLILAAFNLIPVPPLDGSRIAAWFMPNHMLRKYAKLERFGMLIVLILVMGPIRWLFPMIRSLAGFILGIRF